MIPKKDINLAQIIIMAGTFIASLIFWNSIFFYPIRIFVVFLHEMGHGLAAILTGGRVMKIELSPLIGGACWSSGGIRLAIIPAGYLGSMLFGGIILILASKLKAGKIISIVLGLGTIVLAILFVRNTFGLIFSILFGAALAVFGFLGTNYLNGVAMSIVGLLSVLYAVIDIKSDLIDRVVPGSDAWAMSGLIPLPPVAWGVIWIMISIAAAYFFIRIAATHKLPAELREVIQRKMGPPGTDADANPLAEIQERYMLSLGKTLGKEWVEENFNDPDPGLADESTEDRDKGK